MPESYARIVGAADAGVRLDVFLANQPEVAGRVVARHLVEGGKVRVGNLRVRPGLFLDAGQVVEFEVEPQEVVDPLAPAGPPPILRILYEDGLLCAIDKPVGLAAHPPEDKVFREHTVASWALQRYGKLPGAEDAPGYAVHQGSEHSPPRPGLVILVKKSEVGEGEFVQAEHQFRDRRWIERFPGPNIKRGWLEWELTLKTGQRLHLYNTHAQSFAGFWPVRERQYRELGLDVATVPSEVSVIVGGDFNAGWYYPHDQFGVVDGESIGDWWVNATGIPLFVHYSGLSDAHVVVGLAQDVERMNSLPPFDPSWVQNPNGGTCESMPVDTFTATDCNSMYQHSYAAQEYPARLDYLFYRPGALVPVSGEIAYTARDVPDDDRMIELSDHYGAAVTFSLR